MGFNNTWILLTDVLPRAIQKHGGWSAEAIQKAALETDIPEGGTIQGYGVKFAGPGHEMRGQSLRASLVVMQYIGGKTQIVYPKAIATASPVLPLPTTSPYAAR
jgi:branched-chain amino acid transport system substrate-binding protein